MLSPDSRARGRFERALRTAAAVALALALWQSLRPPTHAGTRVAGEASLAAELARWTIAPPDTAIAMFTRAPAPLARDWLVALRRSGSVVRWSGRDLTPIAAAVERAAEPDGSVRIALAAPPGTRASFADEAGALADLMAGRSGGSVSGMRTSGVVTATMAGATARVAPPPELDLRRILVLGSAGWESKFVVAALEERGWTVDARLRVGPGVTVTQGSPADLDTSGYSAVIALDTTAAPWAERIARYTLSGGGAIIAGEASRIRALAAIAPGAVGARVSALPGALTGVLPLRGLALYPVARLRGDAVPLVRRDAMVATAARRAGAGRVLQIGYEDSWRWRMAGGDDASAAHRAWWSGAVSSVASAPARSPSTDPGTVVRTAAGDAALDAAPVAHLFAALGDPGLAASVARGAGSQRPGEWLLAGIALAALLAEWTSRRLRGLA